MLPNILTDLLAERRKVKEMKKHYGTDMGAMLNGKQSRSVVCNSVYKLGSQKGFLSEPRIASSVTKYGRGLTLRTMDSVNSNKEWKGSEVIYSDRCLAAPLLLRVNGGTKSNASTRWARTYSERRKGVCRAERREVWSDKG